MSKNPSKSKRKATGRKRMSNGQFGPKIGSKKK